MRAGSRANSQQVAKRDMDDVSSGNDKTRVPEEAASDDGQVASTPKAPDNSLPQNRQNQASSPLDSEATIISAVPLRMNSNAATIVSGADTVISGGSVRRDAPRQGESVLGTGAILLEIGTILGGRYEMLELLGQGGMGSVYKAADREVDRIVAVKVIRPEMASNPEILARFKQELLLSSQVTDRNVIRIYDLGEAQGVRFIKIGRAHV